MSETDRKKWDAKYRDVGGTVLEPSRVFTALDNLLPNDGRALDVAGGTGRHAIWLAKRGLKVTLADISEIGLRAARRFASDASVTIETICCDLGEQPLPPGPWNLVVSSLYLSRILFSQFPKVLAPGGLLVFLQPTKKNLECHEKPPEPFLLNDGELPSLVLGLEVLEYREGWLEDGRHDALLVARRPG